MSKESNDRPPSSEDGIAIQVFGEANRGGRKHMEDVIGIELQTKGRGQAFVAVFDGHGGKEAAHFADKELWPTIRSLEGFETTDSETVKKAITRGFRETHKKMWSVRGEFRSTYCLHPFVRPQGFDLECVCPLPPTHGRTNMHA